MSDASIGRQSLIRCLMVAASLLVSVSAFAQDVTLAPVLRSGDTFRLELIRVRENSSQPRQNGTSITPIDVRVLSSTPEGITLDWTPGEAVLSNTQLAQDPLVTAASKALGGLTLRIRLNAAGEFVRLDNEADVSTRVRGAVDGLIDGLAAKLPVEQRKPLRAALAQVLSPAVLLAGVTREVQMFFGLNGLALRAGGVVEIRVNQPNPFGGRDIPATLRIEVTSATPQSASLKTTTTFDAAAIEAMTLALAQQVGKPLPPAEVAKLPRVQMSDQGTYVFDRTVGLIRELIVNREISAGTTRRFDRWEMRLVEAPRR